MSRFVNNAFLLLLSLVVALLIAEGGLRLVGFSAPYFTRVDPLTGFSLRPGATGWQTEEGRAFIQINSAGLRDREHAIAKPADTIRIAVLGDSFTEARQVDRAATFWSIAEQKLAQCPLRGKHTIEVLNFGVSGFGTTQEYEQLRDRVWSYDPDIVVLEFTTGNDIRNNSFAMEHSDQKPYFRSESGALVLDTSFRSTPFFRSQMTFRSRAFLWMINHSRVLQLLNRTRLSIGKKSSLPATEVGSEPGLDDAAYRPPATPEWREAWTITETVLGKLAEDVRGHGKPLLIMIASSGLQVLPGPAERARLLDALQVKDPFYPDQRIAAWGQTHDVPVLLLAPTMQRAADATGTFFHGFSNAKMGGGHWNEAGHAFAGEKLAQELCSDTFLRQ